MADLKKLVDVLKKSELAFEVSVRGGADDTVEKMRTMLRDLLHAGVEPDLSVFSTGNFGHHLSLVKQSLCVLLDDCGNLESVEGDEYRGVADRVAVFERRVDLLRQALGRLPGGPDAESLKLLNELKGNLREAKEGDESISASPQYAKLRHPAEKPISTLPRTDGCNLDF